jgi:predicted anti-sigma-YlaC factor YlaD
MAQEGAWEAEMTERGKLSVLAAVALVCLVTALVGWGVSVVGAQEDEPVGRYQVAVPDLMLDTATGRLVDGKGSVVEQAIDPSNKESGRYTVDGYVTVITRVVGLNIVGVPFVQQEMVKGYVIGDSKTGRVLRQRIYETQPVAPTGLQVQ